MNKIIFLIVIFVQTACLYCEGQMNPQLLKTDLEPHRISGRRHPFQRNLSFAAYKTSKLRRTVGSFFMPGTINPLNDILVIESIPLLRNERYRNKDVFRFTLNKQNKSHLRVECRALLKVREKFMLLRKQDSSFFGTANTDFLIATVVPAGDTASKWIVTASNLNATKDEPQKGKLLCKDDEVIFELTNLLLQESNNPEYPEKKFTTLNMVYAFTYKGEIVAAVTVKERNRKFWIKKDLNDNLQDAVAATAVILTIRRNLYH